MLKPDHYKFFQDEVKRQEALQIELAIAASLADYKPENFSQEGWQTWNEMTTGAPLTRAQFEAHQRQYQEREQEAQRTLLKNVHPDRQEQLLKNSKMEKISTCLVTMWAEMLHKKGNLLLDLVNWPFCSGKAVGELLAIGINASTSEAASSQCSGAGKVEKGATSY